MSSQSAYTRRNSFRDYTSEKDDNKLKIEKSTRTPSPRKQFEMVSQGGKLAQEIHDEFLLCKICLEAYKSPKSLDCLHTFCEKCIESHVNSESTYKKYSDYREFTCPLCRKRTQLPIGGVKKLPDNFLVSNLSEIIGRQKPSKFPFCDICKIVNHKHREASSKCLDCAKLLCKSCVDFHKDTKVTSNHSIFDIEIEKDIECKEHQDEVVRFYCEPCETCICVLCTFNEHKDHEISQFGEAVTKYRDNIQGMLNGCKGKISKFDDQLESLTKVEKIIKGAEQKIHDTAIQFISDIRTREKHLLEELRNLYGNDLMEYVENKEEVTATVEGLRSTCSLTEVILKGKDIELLLLKKDVQKKLTTLGEIEIRGLPKTIDKVITFLPGEVELGVIEDKDRPFISKMRNKIMRTVKEDEEDYSPGDDDDDYLIDEGTQTDLKLNDIRVRKDTANTENDDTDSEDEEGETSGEGESDEEEEGFEKEYTDQGIQTEDPEEESEEEEEEEEEEEKPEMIDSSTITDEVSTEEKAVNTRSRSLQSMQSQSQPQPREEDNSLAARRRRRRERAATTHFGSYSVDVPDSSDKSRYLQNHHSMDSEDIYFDADTAGNSQY